jgi:hypothetical protein
MLRQLLTVGKCILGTHTTLVDIRMMGRAIDPRIDRGQLLGPAHCDVYANFVRLRPSSSNASSIPGFRWLSVHGEKDHTIWVER